MSADPHLVELVQQLGEDWITLSRRWDASPFGRAQRAKADELRVRDGLPPKCFGRRTVSALIDRTESRFRGF